MLTTTGLSGAGLAGPLEHVLLLLLLSFAACDSSVLNALPEISLSALFLLEEEDGEMLSFDKGDSSTPFAGVWSSVERKTRFLNPAAGFKKKSPELHEDEEVFSAGNCFAGPLSSGTLLLPHKAFSGSFEAYLSFIIQISDSILKSSSFTSGTMSIEAENDDAVPLERSLSLDLSESEKPAGLSSSTSVSRSDSDHTLNSPWSSSSSTSDEESVLLLVEE